MDANHTLTAVYGPGPLAPRNVPEATGYTLVYSLAVPNQANFNTGPVPYEVDNHASVGGFTRIAYYVELQLGSGALQYLWVSLDPFSADITKIGVPNQSSGAVFQQLVANMNVRSSVAGIVNGDAIGTGNIEFWPTCYGPSNPGNVPGASATVYDWGDSTDPGSYGSMRCITTRLGRPSSPLTAGVSAAVTPATWASAVAPAKLRLDPGPERRHLPAEETPGLRVDRSSASHSRADGHLCPPPPAASAFLSIRLITTGWSARPPDSVWPTRTAPWSRPPLQLLLLAISYCAGGRMESMPGRAPASR